MHCSLHGANVLPIVCTFFCILGGCERDASAGAVRGIAGDGGVASQASEIVEPGVRNRFLGHAIRGEYTAQYIGNLPFARNFVDGVHLEPAGVVYAVWHLGDYIWSGAAIDVKQGSSSRGERVLYRTPQGGLNVQGHGVAATSFVDNVGNRDGLFVVSDPDTSRFVALTIDGESPSLAFQSGVITGISSADYSVIPAVIHGRVGGVSKVLMAYVEPGGPSGRYVVFGYLARQGGGNWSFNYTWKIRAAHPSYSPGVCSGVKERVVADFDPTRSEFGVAWVVDGCTTDWGAYVTRVAFSSGIPTNALYPFPVHLGPSDNWHGGISMAINRQSGRYLIAYQHNASRIVPSGTWFSCSRVAGNCAPDFAPNVFSPNCTSWAIAGVVANHWFPFEFRGASVQTAGCADFSAGTGLALELPQAATSGQGWVKEGSLWDAGGSYVIVSQSMVRASQRGTTVAFYVREPSSSSGATEVRYSFVDEAGGFND
ncbi:MAG: hypothetical protein KF901_05860 [Myxococcales bacterium]|nr:hypothetical protein [Myxococcales bacterium]